MKTIFLYCSIRQIGSVRIQIFAVHCYVSTSICRVAVNNIPVEETFKRTIRGIKRNCIDRFDLSEFTCSFHKVPEKNVYTKHC